MLDLKKITLGTILFLFSLLLGSVFSRFGIDLHHQGIMYNAAKCVFQGEKLYVDCYFHYGPIVAYLHSFSLLILGDKLSSINIFTSFCYSIFYVQIFYFLTKKFSLNVSFIFCFLWLLMSPYLVVDFLPWSSVIVLIPYTYLLYSFIFNTPTRLLVLLWGFIVAIIFYLRQSIGIPLFLLMPLCLILRVDIKKSIKYYFFIGFMFLILLFTFLMQKNGIFKSYVDSAIFGQFKFVSQNLEVDSKNYIKSLYFIIKKIINCFFYQDIYFEKFSIFWRLLLFIFIITTFFNLKNNYTTRNFTRLKIEVSIFILSAISLIQIFPVPCIRHYFWAFSPIIPVIMIQFHNYYKRAVSKNSLIELFFIYSILFIISIYAILNLHYRIYSGLINRKEYKYETTFHPILVGMRLNNAEKYFFDSLINFKEVIVVQQSDFMPLLLTNFTKKNQVDIRKQVSISNYPLTNQINFNSLKINGLEGYREKIRNNGKVAYFESNTLYFKR